MLKKNPRSLRRRLSGPSAGTKPYTPTISLRSIDGHLTRTSNTVTAWYRLAPQRWSFRNDLDRERLIQAVAAQYSELQGRWLHIRVTSRPFPIAEWAKAHTRTARGGLPDVPGGLSFDDYLVGEQRQLFGQAMSDKEVYLGVEVRRRSLSDVLVDQARPLLQRVWPNLLDSELADVADQVRHLDQVVGAAGLQGRPVAAEEMRWLLDRSCRLGMPAPREIGGTGQGVWDPDDLAALTQGCAAYAEPYAPTVTVQGRAGSDADLERHVAVLTVGLTQPMEIPQVDQPWMQRADELPFSTEWSARIYVRTDEEVRGELHRQVSKVKSQVSHYEIEHGIDSPQQLDRQAARASTIEDELNSNQGRATTRVKSWWRLAVSGATRRDALSYAQQAIDLYKGQLALEHPEAQYHLRREFIPGEPMASPAGYTRRADVSWAAAAMPTANSDVGDRRGILLGETAMATRRPVAWDPWMAQETRNGSGLSAIVAGLGGGKSFLGGGIVYKTLRAGASWTVLDPSGPLARLAEIPELRPYSRVINLLNAEPGILNPFRVVPDPSWEDFADEEDPQAAFNRARNMASATRRRLAEDVLLGVLPAEIARTERTQTVLKRAARTAGSLPNPDPGKIIDQLAGDDSEHREHAKVVHGFLDDMREQLRLLIPDSPEADPYAQLRDDRLTVLTMPGLTLPKPEAPREHWTDNEALGLQLLSLAAWLTQSLVYSEPPGYQRTAGQQWRHHRKGVWIDEAFFLSNVATGRMLMDRFARDSRKWNVRVLLSSQVPADLLQIPGFDSLVDALFVGALKGREAPADALRLLGVPVGEGYEDALASLARAPRSADEAEHTSDDEPRRFIFADGAGGIERIRVDFSGEHLRHLRDALDTTPGSTTADRSSLRRAASEGEVGNEASEQAEDHAGGRL